MWGARRLKDVLFQWELFGERKAGGVWSVPLSVFCGLSLRTSHFVAFLPGRTRQAWFTTPLLAFAARRNGFFSIAKSRAAAQAEELEDHLGTSRKVTDSYERIPVSLQYDDIQHVTGQSMTACST